MQIEMEMSHLESISPSTLEVMIHTIEEQLAIIDNEVHHTNSVINELRKAKSELYKSRCALRNRMVTIKLVLEFHSVKNQKKIVREEDRRLQAFLQTKYPQWSKFIGRHFSERDLIIMSNLKKKKSLKDIGIILGISGGRVSQLRDTIRRKLNHPKRNDLRLDIYTTDIQLYRSLGLRGDEDK